MNEIFNQHKDLSLWVNANQTDRKSNHIINGVRHDFLFLYCPILMVSYPHGTTLKRTSTLNLKTSACLNRLRKLSPRRGYVTRPGRQT